jgi:hypothetical protein
MWPPRVAGRRHPDLPPRSSINKGALPRGDIEVIRAAAGPAAATCAVRWAGYEE